MTTKEYMLQVRDLTGFSDYKIAKDYDINQSNLSKYSSGKVAFSETHAFIFAEILGIDPTKVMIESKIENAKNKKNIEKLKFWEERLENIEVDSSVAKITISQFNPIVGDISGNTLSIIQDIKDSSTENDLIIFPELAICGYPPQDLLLHSGFKEEIENNLMLISAYSKDIDVILGCPTFENNNIYNSAILFRDGKMFGIYHKRILPNYGVFDEKRYFTAGENPFIFTIKDEVFSIIICEDTWSQDIIVNNKSLGVNTIISINASPYSIDKYTQRINAISLNAKNNNINIIYVNMVGSQDNLVFDGGSFFIDNLGVISKQLPFFTQSIFSLASTFDIQYNEIANGYKALVLGVKDYFNKSNCFNGVIIALSGGIDSALTLSIAVDAIGPENVKTVMMPYIHTANNSLVDAQTQAQTMSVNYQEINIKQIVDSYNLSIENLNGVALENIQARIRGNIVMSIANSEGLLLLTTSNKSESAVGYTTLYGDMSGGFAPIKDVYKTDVYKLAEYRNTISEVIPKNVLTKEPTAELAPNQFDSNTLPPYDILDKILNLFIENSLSSSEIIAKGFDEKTVLKIIKMVKNNEHKRFQSSLGTKFSNKAFDNERRYPIVNKFNF